VEDLAVKGLARTRMAKSVYDAGWSTFVHMLEYKARLYGRQFRRIGRFEPTSQVCSACGARDGPKPLHIRAWRCRVCGAWLDRDVNAAVNVARAAGLAVTACGAQVRPEVIPAQPADAPVIHVRGLAYKSAVEITTRPARAGRSAPVIGRPGLLATQAAAEHGMMGAVTWKAPDVERPEGPLAGPERPMLQAFLDWHRATLLYKCAGLTGAQMAGRTVPPSDLSLLGLVRHMTKVERTWFRQRFAGEPVDDLFGGDKTADFERADAARAAADYARLTEEFKLADAAVAHASLDDTYTTHDNEQISLRLIYLHMIEEYARHLGHADLLRERIDGTTGE
jgi:Protein of unknown function (DUF664)/Putative transposase DNA-binding domain